MQTNSTTSCCYHCKQEYPINSLKLSIIDNEEYLFCCSGCELAFSLLKENNLESFYQKLGNNSLQTKFMQGKHQNIDYNASNFQAHYVKQRGKYSEVNLIIDGIVCAACVWLNEKILQRTNGIHEVSINYTNYKAKILFNPNEISLQDIINIIQRIGYKPIVYDSTKKESLLSIDSTMYIKIIIAIFCTMNIMWVNVGQYSGYFLGIDSISVSIMNLASFILATPTLFYCASGFYGRAYKGLKNGVIGMDMLVVTGTSLVYFYSIFAWLTQSGHTYFESVCMIILFVLGAKFLELLSRKKVSDDLDKLSNILPIEARLDNGEIIPVHSVKKHDRLLVLPGEMLCCDGILISDNAICDYRNITGESQEVYKKQDQSLMAGCIALHKPLIYEAQKEFSDSSISKLARLLEESEFSTPKIATTAFKIAGYFSRVVLSIALLGFLYYLFVDESGFEQALLIAISVIVIACPCALALATPIASMVGLNVGFKNHCIFTKARFLESLGQSDMVVFDKTGTLTEGKMEVVLVDKFNSLDSMATDSSFLDDLELSLIPGRGLHAIFGDMEILAGSEQLLLESKVIDNQHINNDKSYGIDINAINIIHDVNIPRYDQNIVRNVMKQNPHPIANAVLEFLDLSLESKKLNINNQKDMKLRENSTRFYIAYKSRESKLYKLAYIFYLQDSIKGDADKLIQILNSLNKKSIILSGDRHSSVSYIASKLNIESFYANQTPHEKAQIIKDLIEQGKKVVMVGDGLNDSLALKYAQVGIVMGSGSEIAIANSDVIILDSKLSTLTKAFVISQKTLLRIKQNLIISLIYNVIAIPFALCGYVIPLFAAIFMSVSSITVVLNSLRQ
ncbi:heavy metal translocating P-type ATPase [Helicobacter muridarum]|uniref:Cation-transporting P-type ATPase n=1 Tax=Helicobacter muridarum TaxID=216 RepID=A0A099TYR1_9HELI|nr:heavy metal translocating P-type ATPase [Helicobacter muridarum]TLE00316.1 heavy metal translocating P-type ATPase [Helicobacter muridarum]STQ85813.1 cation-transporting P-type ATPase [Helicobacter muridarum]